MRSISLKQYIICGVMGMCSIAAWSQQPTDGELSLSQCRELAIKSNKEAASARELSNKMGYETNAYRANYFPYLKLKGAALYSTNKWDYSTPEIDLVKSLGITAENPLAPYLQAIPNTTIAPVDLKLSSGISYVAGLMLEQPIFMGGKITSAYKMAKLGKQMALLNEKLTDDEVIVKTDEAYMQCVRAKELGVVAKKYNEMLKELLKNVQSAYKHGVKPYNDVLRVQVKLNESELQVRRAENGQRLAAMNLCHYIGMPLTSRISVNADDIHVGNRLTSYSTDITNRPEFAILEKQAQIARQQVNLTRSDYLPNIGVSAGGTYMNALKGEASTGGNKLYDSYIIKGTSFSAMLNVSVPIFHFGEGHNKVKAAKAELLRTQLAQSDKHELMQLELAQAGNNLDEAYLECDLTKKSLEQADENVRLSSKQYDAGVETLTDLLEAQALWQQAYANEVEARCNGFIALTKYLKASGQLNR